MTKNVPHMGFDPFAKLHFVRRGQYLAAMLDYSNRVPNLPWPNDLYQDRAVKQQTYFVQAPTGRIPPGEKCDWVGCNHRHNQAVTWTRRGDFGHGWRVSYFCSSRCKDYAVKEANK